MKDLKIREREKGRKRVSVLLAANVVP